MSSIDGVCLAAAFLLAGCAPAYADALALSDLPQMDIHRGQRIASGTLISIPEGQDFYVIDDGGTCRHLFGRWEGRLNQPHGSGFDFNGLVDLLAPKGYEETVAPRGPDHPSAPDSNMVDVTASGAKCFDPTRPVMLWHPASGSAFSFTLSHPADGRTVRATWPAGTPLVAWPTPTAPRNGDAYLFAVGNGSLPVSFSLTASATVSRPSLASAEALARSHCLDQAYVMLQWLADHNPAGRGVVSGYRK